MNKKVLKNAISCVLSTLSCKGFVNGDTPVNEVSNFCEIQLNSIMELIERYENSPKKDAKIDYSHTCQYCANYWDKIKCPSYGSNSLLGNCGCWTEKDIQNCFSCEGFCECKERGHLIGMCNRTSKQFNTWDSVKNENKCEYWMSNTITVEKDVFNRCKTCKNFIKHEGKHGICKVDKNPAHSQYSQCDGWEKKKWKGCTSCCNWVVPEGGAIRECSVGEDIYKSSKRQCPKWAEDKVEKSCQNCLYVTLKNKNFKCPRYGKPLPDNYDKCWIDGGKKNE